MLTPISCPGFRTDDDRVSCLFWVSVSSLSSFWRRAPEPQDLKASSLAPPDPVRTLPCTKVQSGANDTTVMSCRPRPAGRWLLSFSCIMCLYDKSTLDPHLSIGSVMPEKDQGSRQQSRAPSIYMNCLRLSEQGHDGELEVAVDNF